MLTEIRNYNEQLSADERAVCDATQISKWLKASKEIQWDYKISSSEKAN